jgi:hypothetical protein
MSKTDENTNPNCEMATMSGISRSIQNILKDNLKTQHTAAELLSHLLNEEQEKHVNMCQDI